MASRLVRVNPVTVNEVLEGHVKLDLECLDRVYLHGYLGQLQVSGQVVQFLRHRGFRVLSPACLQQIGDGFRRSVASFADANHIPVVRLKSADRNIEVMQRYLSAAARTGRSQVAAIGPPAARTIAALLTLRDQVIAPILAGIRSPKMGRKPRTGHASTVTTNKSASICKRSSAISPSKRR